MDLIERAKAVIQTHEEYARHGDLELVMTNVDPDIVLVAADSALVRGEDSFRAFYDGLLSMGQWDFTHDYEGADVIGALVFLHGVAPGTFKPNDGPASDFRNNFLHVLRPGEDGRLRIWRAAFAPAAPSS